MVTPTLLRRPGPYLVVCALFLLTSGAAAETVSYPQRPITLVVGYPAGGSADLVARTLGQDLSAKLGQPVVIENLSGAGGSIGATKVAGAAPDGYTLLVGANNEVAINALVKRSIKYSLKDFTLIGLLGSQPLLLATSPQSGVKNTADFLRTVRAVGECGGILGLVMPRA